MITTESCKIDFIVDYSEQKIVFPKRKGILYLLISKRSIGGFDVLGNLVTTS